MTLPREYKFKGWNGETKEMLPPEDLTMGPQSRKWLGKKDVVLREYTGLKDNDETEIYEGDIVMVANYFTGDVPDYRKAQVVMDLESSGFIVRSFKGEYYGSLGLKPDIKVIGNIYENPELLEKSE